MRIQGEAIATNFIEQLRGNIDITSSIGGASGEFVGTIIGFPGEQYKATVPTDTKEGLPKKTFERQLKDVREQMKSVARLSVLCYRVNTEGFVRVTYRWTDNEDKSNKDFVNQLKTASSSLCPTSFSQPMTKDGGVISNMVNIYAQL